MSDMNTTAIAEILRLSPVMPVVTIEEAAAGPDLARALVNGGIRVIEVTLRTAQALRAIEAIAREVPDICLGAGTVMSQEDLSNARQRGRHVRDLAGHHSRVARGGVDVSHPVPACSGNRVRASDRDGRGVLALQALPGKRGGWSERTEGFLRSIPKRALLPYWRSFAPDSGRLSRAAERALRWRFVAHAKRRGEGTRLEEDRSARARSRRTRRGSALTKPGLLTAAEPRRVQVAGVVVHQHALELHVVAREHERAGRLNLSSARFRELHQG